MRKTNLNDSQPTRTEKQNRNQFGTKYKLELLIKLKIINI